MASVPLLYVSYKSRVRLDAQGMRSQACVGAHPGAELLEVGVALTPDTGRVCDGRTFASGKRARTHDALCNRRRCCRRCCCCCRCRCCRHCCRRCCRRLCCCCCCCHCCRRWCWCCWAPTPHPVGPEFDWSYKKGAPGQVQEHTPGTKALQLSRAASIVGMRAISSIRASAAVARMHERLEPMSHH